MSLDVAIRLTEILLAFAFVQQSIEHLHGPRNEQYIFIPRLFLSILLLLGFYTQWICVLLSILSLFILNRYQGPYNGGSDRMSHLILFCLCIVHFVPSQQWQEYVFGYLALQLLLSYFIAGWVKIVNPEWRSGRALQDVFSFSAYPVSESLRGWVQWPKLLFAMSWAVMVFEVLFPFALFSQTALVVAMAIATIFHLANAFLFGLNRFFWIWLAAYPSLLWLQDRIFL